MLLRKNKSKTKILRLVQPCRDHFKDIGIWDGRIVKPWCVDEHDVTICDFWETELDRCDFVRTRLKIVPNPALETCSFADKLEKSVKKVLGTNKARTELFPEPVGPITLATEL